MPEPYYQDQDISIFCGDALEVLPAIQAGSVHCCVTSPPYWGLRDYGIDSQLGLESTPEEYVARLVEVFRGVRRVLRDDGTLWLNLGDSYARDEGKGEKFRNGKGHRWSGQTPNGMCGPGLGGLKPKDLVGIPWRVAFALQTDGWYLRSDIIWAKPNPMPESVTDRPTKAHEYLFLLAKNERYYYDAEAILEPITSDRAPSRKAKAQGAGFSELRAGTPYDGIGDHRNRRSVWTIPTQPYPEAHFATFPEALIEPCIKAGCPPGGTILDCFAGSGTTGTVARRMGCQSLLVELNPAYCELIAKRVSQGAFLFSDLTPRA